VRRIHDCIVSLKSVVLVPLSQNIDTTSLDKDEVKKSLLVYGHVMAQGGVTLLPRVPQDSGCFNIFYVVDCSPVLQGILTKDSIVIVLNDRDSGNNNNNDRCESVFVRELYNTLASFSGSKDRQQSPTRNTLLTALDTFLLSPSKPLVLSSFMLPLSGTTSPRTTPPLSPTATTTTDPLVQNESSVLKMSSLLPSRSTSLPSSPRTLSPSSHLTSPFLSNSLSTTTDQVETKTLFLKLLEAPLSDPQPPPASRDVTLEVGVTLKTLKYLRLFSGSWVLITATDTNTRRIGRIYALDPPLSYDQRNSPLIPLTKRTTRFSQHYQDLTLYVSPLMLFNLGLDLEVCNNNAKIILLQDVTKAITAMSLSSTTWLSRSSSQGQLSQSVISSRPSLPNSPLKTNVNENLIGPATEVYISRVITPNSSGYVSYAKALQKYFTVPRILKVGDIISVKMKMKKYLHTVRWSYSSNTDQPLIDEDESDEDEEHEDKTDKKREEMTVNDEEFFDDDEYQNLQTDTSVTDLVHFKVTKATSRHQTTVNNEATEYEFVVVEKGKTNLYQEGAVHSKIAPFVHSFFCKTHLPAIPPGYSKFFSDLCAVIKPCVYPWASSLGLCCSVLLAGPSGVGKTTLIHAISSYFGVHLFEKNCYDLIGQSDSQTEQNLRNVFRTAMEFVPCILYLKHVHAFQPTMAATAQGQTEPIIANALKENVRSLISINKQQKYPLLVIGSTEDLTQLSRTIRSCFHHEIQLQTPDEKQRLEILNFLCRRVSLSKDVSLKEIARRTASFTARDLQTVVKHAGTCAINRTLSITEKDILLKCKSRISSHLIEEEICCAGVAIALEDFDKAISQLQSQHFVAFSAPKIPNVKWEDVGGLLEAKKEILDTIQLPLAHPELFAEGLRQRSGILLYGPPGTGKTLLAKAVATECSLNFISVKGPELINMYVGESERNVREVFQKAREARPCVIFFDELDALAPNRGRAADSGGVMDRVVSQLLAELSQLNQQNDIFVIGATNRPDLVDPALLVPGRFDKLLYLGICEDRDSQLKIMKALTRKFNLAPGCSLENVVNQCPTNLTGADFYALCSDALMNAIREQVMKLEAEAKKQPDLLSELRRGKQSNVIIQVEERHFLEALKSLTPSVSNEELQRYKSLRDHFKNRR
jgi:SpoVK/Ycf46/Vps4 family AAA+-type ATPase